MSARPRISDRIRTRLGGLSTRDRRALLLGLAILVPAFGWVGIVRPWWNQVSELRETAAAERALLDRERALLRDGPKLPERMAAAELSLRRKEARLVQHANLALAEAAVAEEVEANAGASRALLLDVRSLEAGPGDAPPEGLVPIRLGLRAESDFQGLLTFLNRLEAHPILFRLVALSMQPGEESGVMTLDAIVEAFAPDGRVSRDDTERTP